MNRRQFLSVGGATLAATTLRARGTAESNAAPAKATTDFSAQVSVVKTPPITGGNRFYLGNRAPLLESPLIKLPIGSIQPRGWLRQQLLRMADGMTGRLADHSTFLHPTSGWLTFIKDREGWEELPYWLRGYGDLGYVLKNEKIVREAQRWLDASREHQQEDGYFGPPLNKEKNDLWPNMLMVNAFQSLYEWNGDKRILPFLLKYFRFQSNLPREKLLPGSWQKMRGGDNLASIYWLYNRTGAEWLLELARAVHERTDDWTSGVPTPHGVNIAQGFREPGTYYQQAKDAQFLEATERDYATVFDEYGQVPGGGFAADENYRPGKTGAQQATETCTWVELMHSFEMLLKITGNPLYADRCEDVAFNSLPASQTADLKGLHYLTAPNLAQCDAGEDHAFQNVGYLLPFSPRFAYRCCQHNVAFGWPYYAEHLWMATPGNGLAAALYASCAVEAKVGRGVQVGIEEETNYPFGETVTLKLTTPEPVRFPLLLRVPAWCEGATVNLNGRKLSVEAAPQAYIQVDRTWKNGDLLELHLPMKVAVKTWKKQDNAVSVYHGPLAYSLKIGQRWEKIGGTDEWPELAVYPTTPWNIGVLLGADNPAASFRVVRKTGLAKQPFDLETAPIELHGKGRVIPDWTLVNNTVGPVPPSPAQSNRPDQDITLIPMGCARLRVSVFPKIG
jgi:hypothetical protein